MPRPLTRPKLNMSTHVDKYDHLYKDYLEVREDDIFGRGVYSKTVIATGVEVIKSDPIVHVISKKERRRICDWCATRRQLVTIIAVTTCNLLHNNY